MSLSQRLTKLRAAYKHRRLLRAVISSYVFFLDNPEQTVWGSITEEDEAGIARAMWYAKGLAGPVVEIGSLFGHTTCLLAALKEPQVPLVAVENFTWNPFLLSPTEHRLITRRTLRYVLDHCSTSIFDGDAADFYATNPNLKPSMVFIDAAHDYASVQRDIQWALSTGCPVISGHDYSRLHPGVMRAVDEAFLGRIETYGSVWIAQHLPSEAA